MITGQPSKLRSACRSGIFGVLAFAWTIMALAPSALAQTGLSVMGPDANGNITGTDTTGDRFSLNIHNLSVGPDGMPVSVTFNGTTQTALTAVSTIPITITLASGASRTDPLTIQLQPGNLLSVTGNLLTGPVSCTINTATLQPVGGNCGAVVGSLTGPLFGIIAPGVTISPAQAAAMATAPSAKNAATAAVRAQTLAVTNMISDRIRAISRDLASGLGQPSGQPAPSSYRGISAGSADGQWGVWGDASGSFIGNSSSVGYDGTSVVALAGIDYIGDRDWLVGFNTGYTNGDLGLKSFTGTRTSNGALVGPYASYIISPNFSVDGQFSYTRLSNNISTVAPGPTGGFNSNRYTGAANLNAYADSEVGIRLTLFTGYAYSFEESQPSVLSNVPPFTNSIHFGVFKLGGEAGYPVGAFEPYVPLTFEYQTTQPQDQTGRAALQVGIGLRYQLSDQLKAGLLFTATEFEENWRDLKIEGHLRWTF
jgi:hypothetical protein